MVSIKDVRYQVLKNLFGPMVTDMLVPTEIVGEGNLPASGPGLLVSNHRSLMDPYMISAKSRRVINWVMAPFVSSIPLFGWLAEQAGAISIIQSEEGKAEALVARMEKIWRQGRLIGIYPEGMGSFSEPVRPDQLNEFRGTFMRAVLRAKVHKLPVIPSVTYARQENVMGEVSQSLLQLFDPTERMFKGGGSMTLIGYQDVLVLIGKPLYFDAYYAQYKHPAPGEEEAPEQAELVAQLTGQVKGAVQRLLDQAVALDSPHPSALAPEAQA